jgi:hypothetical protein
MAKTKLKQLKDAAGNIPPATPATRSLPVAKIAEFSRELRDQGLGTVRIAKALRYKGYTTMRGKEISAPTVWNALKRHETTTLTTPETAITIVDQIVRHTARPIDLTTMRTVLNSSMTDSTKERVILAILDN